MSTEHRFTCISWASGRYVDMFAGLRSDCERWGYRCHLYEIEKDYPSLMSAWCNHPYIIKKGIEDFGTVLFLDVECRIVAPIPDSWRAPLVSIRWPAQKFWIYYNSGTVMADESCLPWIDAWIRVIDSWKMGELDDADHVHWPGDLCDELALGAALTALGVEVRTPRLEYVHRYSTAELARGYWKTPHTIIQHPTQHHWPRVQDLMESKKLFEQNYAGAPQEAERLLSAGAAPRTANGWTFDPSRQLYAPCEYWPEHARPWFDGPVQLTSAQR
ncbi:hypothetical protein ACPRNU_04890 [Chromobacterium vaccinii]|uniref:hypothetical protein n=1 Tax=Chromobacterium vaccinii TaxID=1108595 RepID=UPI003C711A51